jgi:hypothetical protein
MKRYAILLAVCAVCASGCDAIKNLFGGSSTSPSGTSSPNSFTGTLTVGGTSMFTFTTTSNGAASVTLTSLGTATPIGVGIGTFSGTTCTLTTSSAATSAGATPQVTATLDAGTYCVEVFDPGTLTVSTTFGITVTHN